MFAQVPWWLGCLNTDKSHKKDLSIGGFKRVKPYGPDSRVTVNLSTFDWEKIDQSRLIQNNGFCGFSIQKGTVWSCRIVVVQTRI